MHETPTTLVDPVCGMAIDPATSIVVEHEGAAHHFCDIACAETFVDEPERWLPRRGEPPLESDRAGLAHRPGLAAGVIGPRRGPPRRPRRTGGR